MKLYTDRNLGSGSNSGAVRDQHHVLHHCAPEFFYIYHLFRIISRSAQNDDKTGLNLKPIYAPSCMALMGGATKCLIYYRNTLLMVSVVKERKQHDMSLSVMQCLVLVQLDA